MRACWVRLVPVLGIWYLAATVPPDVNRPESQEVFGWKLEACLPCGKGCHLWGQVFPFPLPPCLLPQVGSGLVHCLLALLWNCSVIPPKQCHPLLSVQPTVAGGRCERLGYFSAGS